VEHMLLECIIHPMCENTEQINNLA
jgi:hypothetical protein